MPDAARIACGTALAFSRSAWPRGSEGDQHLPFIFGAARALDEFRRLEPLEQRGQRAGIELQPLADVLDGQAVALPQHQHDEVLRIGQPEPVKQRLIGTVKRVCGGIDRKTELIAEQQRQIRQRVSWPFSSPSRHAALTGSFWAWSDPRNQLQPIELCTSHSSIVHNSIVCNIIRYRNRNKGDHHVRKCALPNQRQGYRRP